MRHARSSRPAESGSSACILPRAYVRVAEAYADGVSRGPRVELRKEVSRGHHLLPSRPLVLLEARRATGRRPEQCTPTCRHNVAGKSADRILPEPDGWIWVSLQRRRSMSMTNASDAHARVCNCTGREERQRVVAKCFTPITRPAALQSCRTRSHRGGALPSATPAEERRRALGSPRGFASSRARPCE